MATRWAICGSGKIAHDFCSALQSLPASEHKIVAVASRSSKERADEFAKKFNIPNSFGSYDDLLKFDDVDVVYVNTIHPYHVENSLMFINAGKSVLCEKTMALTLDGCKEVLKAAKEKQVFFMEGYWSRFFPCYSFIREQIDSGSLGEVRTIEASFCVPICNVARVSEKALGGGGLMDIGCYTVQAARFIFREQPEKIWSDGKVCPKQGVDMGGVIVLRYSGDRFAYLNYNTQTCFERNHLIIRGTKGTIEIPNTFWCPNTLIMNGEVKDFPLPECKGQTFNFDNSQGFTYEAQHVRHCLTNGLTESPAIPLAESEAIMTVLQTVLDNFGIKYDAP